jgi:ubiquitin-conjugating enzyme E2 variant
MIAVVWVAVQVLIAWLLADLVTGAVHWFEDKYLDPTQTLNFLTSVAADNDLHHRRPTAMTLSSGWDNMKSGAAVAWPVALVLWLCGAPLWLWLAAFFAGFGNLIHRWAHMPERKLPVWIRAMQATGLFITHDHHDTHHRSMLRLIPKHLAGYRYCPMTNWVNPVVDYIGLWHRLEWLLYVCGLKTTQKRLESE